VVLCNELALHSPYLSSCCTITYINSKLAKVKIGILQSYLVFGHEAVVKMLLNKGAEINAQGGRYGNALQAASSRGHEAVVKMLLNKGAEVNAQGGYYGDALQAASARRYREIVKLLVDKGAIT
jgi:hypothetical protein